jgi:ABC-type Fe3+-siderophore transport system permease subunit
MTLKKLSEKLDPSYLIPFACFCGMIVGLGLDFLASVEKTGAWMYIVFLLFFLAVTALFTFFLYRLYLFLSKRKQKMNSPAAA